MAKSKQKNSNGSFTGRTHIAFVLDKSGSMAPVTRQTIDGFNEWLTGVKGQGGDFSFTLSLFDQRVTVPIKNTPLDQVKPLDERTYRPDGVTALYDAIGQAVKTMEPQVAKSDRALVVILTDGQENSSTEFTRKNINALIKKLEDKGNWTFTYLSCDPDAFADSAAIGIHAGNTASYVGSAKGTASAMRGVAQSTLAYAGGAMGQSTSFYGGGDEPTHIAEDDDEGKAKSYGARVTSRTS